MESSWQEVAIASLAFAPKGNGVVCGGLEVHSLNKQVRAVCTWRTNDRDFPVSLWADAPLLPPLPRRICIPGN